MQVWGLSIRKLKLLELLCTQSLKYILLMHYVALDHSLNLCWLLLKKTPALQKGRFSQLPKLMEEANERQC